MRICQAQRNTCKFDTPTSLPRLLRVDCNDIVRAHTVVRLVTPSDADTKKLVVSATKVFGYELKCGYNSGTNLKEMNARTKFSEVDVGLSHNILIQFVKGNSLNKFTDFGTLILPKSAEGNEVTFFWPNDVGHF